MNILTEKAPNGAGSISLRKEKRRNPYCVRATIDGKQKCIGYAKTYRDATLILIEFHKNPTLYSGLTLKDVYDMMAKEHYPQISESSVRNYVSAWTWCKSIQNLRMSKIKYATLQTLLNNMQKTIGYATQKKVRSLLHLIYKYAVRYEIIEKDITQSLTIGKNVRLKEKKPFIRRQINKVFVAAETDDWAKLVTILCYTGMRANELLGIKKEDVKLGKRYLIVKESKTESGCNRIIPIHKRVVKYFEYFKEKNFKYFFSENGNRMTYHRFKNMFDKTMEKLNLHHTPHECRHTLATWFNEVGANDTAVKKILGHSVDDITKGVYTHISIKELKKAMNKIA